MRTIYHRATVAANHEDLSMKTRKGTMILADRAKKITPPGTSRMRELANDLKRSGVDVINFAAGELDGDVSEVMKMAAQRAIDEGHNKYTPTLRMKALRHSIAEQVSQRCGTQYVAEEIGVTAGAKQALYNTAMVLFDPGDDIIIPQPYWVTFPAQVEIAGAKPVFVDTRKTGYKLAIDDLVRAITPATKAVIINSLNNNSPNNSTGVIYDREALLGMARMAAERQFWIIFGECYSDLVRAGSTHRNVVQLQKGIKEQTILVNSFSKSHAVTGWRIGYACGPKHVIRAMENFQGHTTSNPCTISRHAAAGALRRDDGVFIRNVNAVLDGPAHRDGHREWHDRNKVCAPTGSVLPLPQCRTEVWKKLPRAENQWRWRAVRACCCAKPMLRCCRATPLATPPGFACRTRWGPSRSKTGSNA
jgi:aspartate aminotransferase